MVVRYFLATVHHVHRKLLLGKSYCKWYFRGKERWHSPCTRHKTSSRSFSCTTVDVTFEVVPVLRENTISWKCKTIFENLIVSQKSKKETRFHRFNIFIQIASSKFSVISHFSYYKYCMYIKIDWLLLSVKW